MKPYGYIYLIIDHLENKIYIGQKKGLPENSKEYYGGGTIMKNILKKRGKIHLEKRIIGLCFSQEELNIAEEECIYFYRAYGSDGFHWDNIYGYNLRPDACVGYRPACKEETAKKISQTKKAKYANGEIIVWNKDKPYPAMRHPKSEETKQKMREQRIGNKNPMYGVAPWNKGKKLEPHSIESNKKRSDTMKQKWREGKAHNQYR